MMELLIKYEKFMKKNVFQIIRLVEINNISYLWVSVVLLKLKIDDFRVQKDSKRYVSY